MPRLKLRELRLTEVEEEIVVEGRTGDLDRPLHIDSLRYEVDCVEKELIVPTDDLRILRKLSYASRGIKEVSEDLAEHEYSECARPELAFITFDHI